MCKNGWCQSGAGSIQTAASLEGHSLENLSAELHTISPELFLCPTQRINSLIIVSGAHLLYPSVDSIVWGGKKEKEKKTSGHIVDNTLHSLCHSVPITKEWFDI